MAFLKVENGMVHIDDVVSAGIEEMSQGFIIRFIMRNNVDVRWKYDDIETCRKAFDNIWKALNEKPQTPTHEPKDKLLSYINEMKEQVKRMDDRSRKILEKTKTKDSELSSYAEGRIDAYHIVSMMLDDLVNLIRNNS